MNTPGDFSTMYQWIVDHLWAVVLGLVGVVWKQNRAAMKAQGDAADKALEAHAKEDERVFHEIRDEQTLQRGHIAKIFDKMEQHSQRAEDRHLELLRALHTGLSSKADK